VKGGTEEPRHHLHRPLLRLYWWWVLRGEAGERRKCNSGEDRDRVPAELALKSKAGPERWEAEPLVRE
jgi:hypothetical protein